MSSKSTRAAAAAPTLRSGAASPFEHNHADPWARSFVDLPTLNARASDAIHKAIRDVQSAAREERVEFRSASLLLLGSAGAGKTHLFARLRRRLGPRAVFIHLRPLVGTEMTPRYVLGEVVKQLSYESLVEGLITFRQLDALVGASLAHLRGEPPHMPRVFLDQWVEDETERTKMLEWALEQMLARHQEIDETYLERLLKTPFMPAAIQRASLAWLGGRDLEESQMSRLGVTSSLSDERIIGALQTLGVFAAPGAPIVLVFDQLENLVDSEGAGSRVRAYGNLVSELFDTMRGFIIVQMALDTEWSSAIEPALSQAQKTRLMAQTELIALPKPDEARDLLRRWSDLLADRAEPFPWPFGERRVTRWAETIGMTPRMLMIECRHALAEGPGDDPELETIVNGGPPTAPTAATPEQPWIEALDSTHEGLDAAWKKHIEIARQALDEAAGDRRCADVARLTGGIGLALRFAAGGMKATRIDARLPIQVEATGSDGNLWSICIVHQNHPRSAAAAIDKAAEVMKAPKSPRSVIVLREHTHDFPPTWKVTVAKQAAIVRDGAQWISLGREDATKLLALESFIAAGRSRDLEDARGRAIEEKEVVEWIQQELGVAEWAPIHVMTGVPRPVEPTESVEPLPPPVKPTATTKPKASKTPPPSQRNGDTAGTIRACLSSLRVVSLDRLMREVTRVRPRTTRADVLEVLERMSDAVEWFGRSIVAFTSASSNANAKEADVGNKNERAPEVKR